MVTFQTKPCCFEIGSRLSESTSRLQLVTRILSVVGIFLAPNSALAARLVAKSTMDWERVFIDFDSVTVIRLQFNASLM